MRIRYISEETEGHTQINTSRILNCGVHGCNKGVFHFEHDFPFPKYCDLLMKLQYCMLMHDL